VGRTYSSLQAAGALRRSPASDPVSSV
jgi:hypothetical protein